MPVNWKESFGGCGWSGKIKQAKVVVSHRFNAAGTQHVNGDAYIQLYVTEDEAPSYDALAAELAELKVKIRAQYRNLRKQQNEPRLKEKGWTVGRNEILAQKAKKDQAKVLADVMEIFFPFLKETTQKAKEVA